jgi:hypothetical protein
MTATKSGGSVMRHPALLGLLLPVLLTATDSWAQSPEAGINAPGGNPRDLPQSPNVHHVGEAGRAAFRTQTILIQVPVVVTDKSGNHIHSLSKEQFRDLRER